MSNFIDKSEYKIGQFILRVPFTNEMHIAARKIVNPPLREGMV